MKITKKIWIAGGLIAALALGGLVIATDESPLVTLGSGCCRVTVSPDETTTAEPTPAHSPVAPATEPATKP